MTKYNSNMLRRFLFASPVVSLTALLLYYVVGLNSSTSGGESQRVPLHRRCENCDPLTPDITSKTNLLQTRRRLQAFDLGFIFISIENIFNFFGSIRLPEQLLEHDGLTRWFLESQPDGFSQDGTAALLILLHGQGEDMNTNFGFFRMATRRFVALSQEHGFLLLAPNAVRTGESGTKDTKGKGRWNNLNPPDPDGDPAFMSEEDDVGFLAKLIEWAVAERKIDPTKVYIAGVSNGGMMMYRMVIEQPDIVSAGAAFVANLDTPELGFDPPLSPTPIFMMHGTKDPIMPFEGSTMVRSSPKTRDYFVQVNQAGPVEESMLPDLDPNDGCQIKSEFYPSATGAPVQYYVQDGAGHTISTRESFGLFDFIVEWVIRFLGGPTCHDAEGVDLAWDFLSQFTL